MEQRTTDNITFDKLCFLAHYIYEKYGEADTSGAIKDRSAALIAASEAVYLVDDVINPFKVAPWNNPSVKWVCEDHPTKEQGHRLFFGFGDECGGAGMPA